MIKISVIIPIYKVQNYIEQCINSIIFQESDDYELECILVDDCSPDNSREIAKQMIHNYLGDIDFVLITHEQNKGASAARNTGMRAATGDFILFVDSDDKLEDDSIKYLVDGLNNQQSSQSIDVVMGNMQLCMDGKPASDINQVLLLDNSSENALQKLLGRDIFHTPCNKLVRHSILKKYDIFFEEGIIDEDLLWSYLVFLHSRSVLIMPKITYIYEDTPGSVMHTTNKRLNQLLRSRIVIANRIMDTPPNVYCPEYYTYLFFILARAVNLFEMNSDVLVSFGEGLKTTKDRLLRETLKHKYFLLYTYFHTLYKPCYYITHLKFYRRYFDRILQLLVSLEKHIS